MVLATTVSDEGLNENVDDGAKSDIVLVLALLAGGTVVIRAKEHRQAVGESAR